MEREIIRTPNAPDLTLLTPPLPLSQAVKVGNLIFTSGVVARDPKTRQQTGGTIEEQTERVLLSLKAILEAGGSSFERVVRTTVFLVDMRDLDGMNRVYRKYFPKDFPARAVVEVSRLALPAPACIEIEVIAVV